jgi:hypothetical protein
VNILKVLSVKQCDAYSTVARNPVHPFLFWKMDKGYTLMKARMLECMALTFNLLEVQKTKVPSSRP